MSYAVRNTIILLVSLFLIVGSGYSYLKFFLEAERDSLQQELDTKKRDFDAKQNINNEFNELNDRYQAALRFIENYDKSLYPTNKPDDVYDFINAINENGGGKIFYDFVFNDSIPDNQYGIIESQLSGFGNYAEVTNFINRIEHSQLLNKISELSISPGRSDDDINDVNFSFHLESYYQKSAIFDTLNYDYNIVKDPDISTYNPLYPLIQTTFPANDEGLVNVETSRMVGITGNRVFLIGQGGKVISLKKGDRVYLGSLTDIDLQKKTATFNLNKGGIQVVVTLEVDR